MLERFPRELQPQLDVRGGPFGIKEQMTWPQPEHSRNEVNRAGRILARPIGENSDLDEVLWALAVAENWRACHGYPINTFQATLRAKTKSIAKDALIAQRLKRMPTIIDKLERYPTMNLSQMQDIGGLRSVVPGIRQVRALETNYLESRFKHDLVRSNDYINEPKPAGYRGVHLVYRYRNPKIPEYDGLLIELQFRTRLQHAWATAVEAVGLITKQALKSSQGEEEWLDFFKLAGSAFAHMERSAPVPGYEHLSKFDAFSSTVSEARRLQVHDRLLAFSHALNIEIPKRRAKYYLIILDLDKKRVLVRPYREDQLPYANYHYRLQEKLIAEGEKKEVVLVSAGDLANLQRAYPNFFLDTSAFIHQLNRMEKTSAASVRG